MVNKPKPKEEGRMNAGSVWSKFQDLGLREKLAIVVGVLALPIIALLALQYASGSADISTAEDEKAGVSYLKDGPIPVLQEVQRHRLLGAAVSAGDASLAAELDRSTAGLDAALERYTKIEADRGYGASDKIALLKEQWASIKAGKDVTTTEGVINAHNRMVDEALLPLIFTAGNESKLFLDPKVATLDTVLATTQDLVNQNEAVSRAAAYAAAVSGRLQKGLAASNILRDQVAAQVQAARTTSDSLKRWLDGAMTADKSFATRIRPAFEASAIASKNFVDKVDIFANNAVASSAGDDIVGRSATATDANYALFNTNANVLVSELDSRIGSEQSSLALTMGLSAAAFAAAVVLAWFVSQSITRPMAHLVAAADRMSLGDLDAEIDYHGSNEVGKLADSLRRMQMSLKGAIERLRSRRAA